MSMTSGSTRVPRIAPARVPIATPSTIQITAAPTTRESVIGIASMICGMTRMPRFTKEVRSWVMKRFFIIIAYCTGSGSSSPKEARTWASVAGSAFLPAILAAGSTPGVAKKIRKTRTLIAKRTSTDEPKRFAIYLGMSGRPTEAGVWVQRVAYAVAEHVERDRGQPDEETGGNGDHRPGVEQRQTVVDDRAPARVRRLHADREEGERRLRQHVQRGHQRQE